MGLRSASLYAWAYSTIPCIPEHMGAACRPPYEDGTCATHSYTTNEFLVDTEAIRVTLQGAKRKRACQPTTSNSCSSSFLVTAMCAARLPLTCTCAGSLHTSPRIAVCAHSRYTLRLDPAILHSRQDRISGPLAQYARDVH